jgi:hypothetical protein
VFPVPKFYTEFHTFLRSSSPFFSRVLPASKLLLLKYREVVFEKNGIGGDGEYFGGNDAQLDRSNVLLAPHANELRDVSRCGALSLQ